MAAQQNQSLEKTSKDGSSDVLSLPTASFLRKTYELEKIKDKIENVKRDLGTILTRIHGEMGFKSEIDQFAKQDLSKMILSYYKTLSFEEIYKAFELERFGMYEAKTDHFQLFDSNYVSEILKKYKKWVIDQKKALNIEAPKTEIEIDKKAIREEYLKTVYNELKTNGFSSGAYGLYNKLASQINASDEQKIELYQKQLKIYKIEEKEYISKRGIQVKSLLNDLKIKIESKSGVESVKNKCKSILVSDYLMPLTNETENEFIFRLF